MAEAASIPKLIGANVGEAAAFAAGLAIGPLLRPYIQELVNEAWAGTPTKPLEPHDLAEAIAQGVLDAKAAAQEASMTGIAETPFGLLAKIADEGPELGTAYNLWRRGYITDDGFTAAVKKSKFEDRWLNALKQLKAEILSPGELAAAIHRGLIPDPGLLKGEQPQPPFTVESYPVYPIPTLDEAAGHGIDKDRLGVLVGLQGLPMGVIEAAHAYYRGIITHGDYIRAFNESNSRNEWAAAVLDYARQIPTARDFFENALRGYHDFSWAVEQAKRHGMSEADATVIYQNQGRPMNIRQITQALSRGATFHPEPGELTDPYEAATVEGSVKPAYYEMFKALKYTLPSPFVMRQLASTGVWTEAKTAKRLKDIGWIPADADEAAKAWANPTGSTADPWTKRAETQLWSATHRAYMAGDATDVEALANLTVLGLSDLAKSEVLGLWANERTLDRARLTATQLKKALTNKVVNPLTNVAWTKDEVLAELHDRGWNAQDANTFLEL